MFGIDPGGSIGRKAASSHEYVNVGMEEHGPGPGVKDRERANARSQVAGIVGEFL